MQEAVIKTIHKKKKYKKAKWLSAEEKEEKLKAKDKRRYTHVNAEFQRIARKDKKAFLNDQCKKENNRMEKNRDLFTKTRGTKGIFHAMMGTIKD